MLNEAMKNKELPSTEFMKRYGYNPKTMSKRERLKVMFRLTKSGKYKQDKAMGRLIKDRRSETNDPRFTIAASYDPALENDYTNTILENPQNKENNMENEIEYTSFSDFITENTIKDNAMGLVYAYVTENFDALVEQASEGNKFALAMLENASAIEEYFEIGE